MVEVKDLSVSYGKGIPNIIEGMTFNIEKGTILNVLGQNAVGKTTLIKTLMRNLPGYKGTILVGGNDIREYSIKEYSRVVGVVATSFNTFQNLLVADYLMTGFINQMTPFSKPNDECISRAYEILEWFGKTELFNKQLEQLSSGERQIIMIARVMIQNPKVIIVDEPTANLDVRNQIMVLNQIKKLSKEGYTIIVTTHNPGHAYSLGGKTLLMGKNKYLFGDTKDVLTAESLSEYYELDVTVRDNENLKCMIFANNNKDEDVKVIF